MVSPTSGGIDFSRILQPGDHVLLGGCAGEPLALTALLVEQRQCLPKIEVLLGFTMLPTITAEHTDTLRITIFGAYGHNRALATSGKVDILPCQLAMLPALIRSGEVPVDVLLVQVSPPNADNMHSLGVTADVLLAAAKTARIVVAEVNEQMPFTYGDTLVPAERLNFTTLTSRPLPEYPATAGSAIESTIGAHVASLVPDRSVLQMGIGRVPDAALMHLHDRNDLGIHSGLVGDSMLDLIECGAVTNARKPMDVGITVAGTLMGSRRLYDWAHENSSLSMRSTQYTHALAVLERLDTFVSINSAIEVDLTGQVNAETIGGKYAGAVGGHVDYVRAGTAALNGRSIIALPSSAANGAISRIVFRLADSVTTTLRTDVDAIVTEYGIAELRGCSLRERARRMIEVAHPNHRERLERSAADLC